MSEVMGLGSRIKRTGPVTISYYALWVNS